MQWQRQHRRGGIIKGCLVLLGLGVATSSAIAADSPSALAVGDRVEVTGLLLCDTLPWLRKRPADGRPPGAQNGRDIFGVRVAAPAVVTALEPDGVQVRIDKGEPGWPNRLGWVRRDEVRMVPTEAESKKDVVRGLTLNRRRQIYQDGHAAAMAATREAERRSPLKGLADLGGDVDAAKGLIASHQAFYEGEKFRREKSVLARHKINRALFDALMREGDAKKWPARD